MHPLNSLHWAIFNNLDKNSQSARIGQRMLTLCGLIKASDLRLCFLAMTKEGATKFS